MRIASIDIGTNTILQLISELDASGSLRVIVDEQVIARLGKGVDREKRILPETFERCKNFLLAYKETALRYDADKIFAVGTSALRDARNRDDFIREMFDATGIRIEIISGDEEAQWTYVGATSGLKYSTPYTSVLDIGGGSTELIIGDGKNILARKSIDIGSVRVTEKFFHHTPPLDCEIKDAEEFISERLREYPVIEAGATTFVGVAGTVTTLAALELHLQSFDRERVGGAILQRSQIERQYHVLRNMGSDELRAHVAIDAGRADIIVAGVLILKMVCETNAIGEVIVSEKGLRYGIALREFANLS